MYIMFIYLFLIASNRFAKQIHSERAYPEPNVFPIFLAVIFTISCNQMFFFDVFEFYSTAKSNIGYPIRKLKKKATAKTVR